MCPRLSMAFALPMLALTFSCFAPGQQAAAQEKEKIIGVVYDVGARDGKPSLVRGKKAMESIVGLIMATVRPKAWRAKDSPHTIFVLHGNKLEIHTTPENHDDIAGLLAALRRLGELSIVIESGLYEIDPAVYEKQIAPRLAKLPGAAPALAIDEDLDKQLRKAAKLLKSGKAKLENGKEGVFFALRRVVPYDAPGPQGKAAELAFPGVAFQGNFIISGDRRYVRMKLVQKTTELVRTSKEQTVDVKQNKRIELDVPEMQELTVSASATVGDGVLVLVPVRGVVPGLAMRKDQVLVLLLRPRIHIPEEEE